MDLVIHTLWKICGYFFAHIRAVRVDDLVCLIYKVAELLAVMYVGGGNLVICDDFAVRIYFRVIFISEMCLISLLCPAGVGILLRTFVPDPGIILFPFLRYFSIFDAFLFLLEYSFDVVRPQRSHPQSSLCG